MIVLSASTPGGKGYIFPKTNAYIISEKYSRACKRGLSIYTQTHMCMGTRVCPPSPCRRRSSRGRTAATCPLRAGTNARDPTFQLRHEKGFGRKIRIQKTDMKRKKQNWIIWRGLPSRGVHPPRLPTCHPRPDCPIIPLIPYALAESFIAGV